MRKIISILLSITVIVLCLSGCGGEKSIDFIYPFSADVNSYDPQVASTSDEFLIIENTFEGLIRINDDGEIKPGVAEKWNVSSDGLTYTFNLRKGAKWNINIEKNDKGEFKDSRLELMGKEFNPDITANDFVFALQRACMPETECPLFPSIACIQNATDVNSGKASYKSLGVKAIDNYTLQINLSTADDGFMSTLTTAVAMPCNEEFFNATKGKYGLDTNHTLFNGQFYVSQILETSYLLNKNKFYTGESPAFASELTLKIIDKKAENETIDRLESGYYDAALLSGFDSEKLKNNDGITLTPYNNTTWAFIFNTNDEIFQSQTARNAFRYGFTRLENTGKEYLTNATNLTPASCVINSKPANKEFGKTTIDQDVNTSVEFWGKALEIVEKTDIEITILTLKETEDQVKMMIQGIQSGIGTVVKNNKGEAVKFTLKVETVTEEQMNTSILIGDYDIAFYPFESKSNSAFTFLKSICENNLTGFDSSDAEYYINKAQQATNTADAISYARNAELELLGNFSILPMLYETSYYASAKGVSNIQFHAGTGRVSFVNATREK